jgi:hypothetical protein
MIKKNKLYSLLFVFIVFLFMFSIINTISAQEEINIISESTQEIIDNDLKNYSSTNFAIKIRLTHLQNSIDTKIKELSFIIEKLNTDGIDTMFLEENLEKLILLGEDIEQEIRENINEIDENQEIDSNYKEELITYYVATKQDSIELINECKEYIKFGIPEDIFLNIKNEVKNEIQENKELRIAQKEKIRNLVDKHNSVLKKTYIQEYKKIKNINISKTEIVDNTIKNEIKEQVKNQIRESKENFIINQKEILENNKEKIINYKVNRLEMYNKYKEEYPNIDIRNIDKEQIVNSIKNKVKAQIQNRAINQNINVSQGDIE